MSRLKDDARWLADTLYTNLRAIKALAKPQLGTSSIESGKIEEYDKDGTLVSVVGEQFDGTHSAVTVAGPPPPEPVAPSVTAVYGAIGVRWNGKFADDAVSPMDFSHVSVHVSDLEIFTPDNTTQKATISGESGDLAMIPWESGECYVVLVAVSLAGKASTPSDVTSAIVPEQASADDILDTLIELDENLVQAGSDISESKARLDSAEQEILEAFGQIATVDGKASDASIAASTAQSKADEARAVADSAIAQAANVVPNPGFEQGGEGWTSPSSWLSYPDDPTAHGGSKVMNWVVPAGATLLQPQRQNSTPVNVGDTWQVSAWVRVVGTLPAAGHVRLAVQTKTADGTAGYPHQVTLLAANMTNEWQRMVGTYTIPANIVSIAFRFRGDGTLTGGTVIQWDDVEMRDITLAKSAIDAAAAAQTAAVTAQTAAGSAQSTADSALTMAGSKSKVFYHTAEPSGTGSSGDLWRRVDAEKNVIAEWFYGVGGWTPSLVTTHMISNLDVGKLSAGSASIAEVVAQKIAAASGSFLQLDVGQITGSSGSFSKLVSEKIWASLGAFNKVTASMIDGVTITGALIRTKASGDRIELSNNLFTAFGRVGSTLVNVTLGPAVVSMINSTAKAVGLAFDNGSAYPGGIYSDGTPKLMVTAGGFGATGESYMKLVSGGGLSNVYTHGALEISGRGGVSLIGGAGPVELSGSSVLANGGSVATTTPDLLPSASHNLNSYTSPGLYSQNQNAGATTGTNYPVNKAGMLEVMSNGTNMQYQRYSEYNTGVMWTRTRYGTTWYPWSEVAQETSWTKLGLQYGWAQYAGGGNYKNGCWVRRFGDSVQITGMVRSGALDSNIAQIPTAWQPVNSHLIPSVANLGFGAVQYDSTTGFLKYSAGPAAPGFLAFSATLPIS